MAKRDCQAFWEAYPEFHRWQKGYASYKDETNLPKRDMLETCSVRGWRRVVSGQYELKSAWKQKNNIPADWVPKYTDRLNGPIQSTAGDILYLTLIKLEADLGAGLHPGTKFLFTAQVRHVRPSSPDLAELGRWTAAGNVHGPKGTGVHMV